MLIGISGKRYAGKDTVGAWLASKLGLRVTAFGLVLKSEYAKATPADFDRLVDDPSYKESHRSGLIAFGAHQRGLDPGFFIDRTLADPTNLVVTDVRFPNEAKAIQELGGALIRVHADPAARRRRGWFWNADIDSDPSEVSLDSWVGWNAVVNNSSTRLELERQLEAALITFK